MLAGVRGYVVDSGGEPAIDCSNESMSGGVCCGRHISQSSMDAMIVKNDCCDQARWDTVVGEVYSHRQQKNSDMTARRTRQRQPSRRNSC